MSNGFKLKDDEEISKRVKAKKQAGGFKIFVLALLAGGTVSKEAASLMLPFVVFIAFLGMVYIGNRHFAEKNIREIDRLGKEIKELSWDYKTLKADLMLKSTQTEIARRADTLGLKEPVEPPKKLLVEVIE